MAGVLVASVITQEELPIITTLDLSDLLSGEERAAAIIERDADAALNLKHRALIVTGHEFARELEAMDRSKGYAPYEVRVFVPQEPAWIRDLSEAGI